MGSCTREEVAAPRIAFMALRLAFASFAALFVQGAIATPASFTGTPIQAQVPDFSGPTTINLRQLGVVTGTAPLAFSTRTLQFLVNGQATSLVQAVPVGAVCVTLVNGDFTPRQGDTYALVIDMQNAQPGGDGPTAVPFTNTPGPVVDPQSPECLDPNTPPTASIAGGDRTIADTNGVAGEPVAFTGTGTDAQGDTLTFQWFVNASATPVATGATATLSLPDGSSRVTLRVTDEADAVTNATVSVTVAPPTTPPSANAGPDQSLADSDGIAGELVTLTGTATGAPTSISSFEWFNGSTSLGSGSSIQPRLPDGTTIVTLRVTYVTGLVVTDTASITIAAPPVQQPPTANAGADQTVADTDGQPGETVTLTGSGTDSDGTIETYQWFIGDTALGSGATLATRIPDGTTAVTLVVTDDSDLTASDTLQVIVGAPVLPVVNAGVARSIADTDLQPGESVQLTGSATTPAGTITAYEWLLGDTSLGNGATITASLPDGINVVTLRATSSLNLVGTASVQITVGAPVRTVLSELPGLTPNERRLAAKLDEACGNVLTDAALEQTPRGGSPVAAKGRAPTDAERADFAQKCRGLVFSRNTAALVDAIGELLGDDFAVARTQTLLFANTQYASVMDRLIALRGGARGLSLAGLNIVVDGELVPLAELQDFAKMLLGGGASSDADSLSENWGLWMRGNYSFGSKENDALSPSFDADQYALLAGLDYRFTANAVAGVALAYGNSTVEFNPIEEGGLDTKSWAASLYGSLYAARNFYLDAIVNVADASYEARRNISYVDGFGLVTADALGDTSGLTVSAGASGGYDFLIGGLTISPTIGVFYIDAQIDEFTESGAGGLNLIYDEQQFKSLTGNLGMRATFAWNMPWGVLLPHLRADYVREFEDDVDVFGIRFASDPNAASTPPILVETENPDTSYWRFAAGFSAQFKHGISGYVEYQRLEGFEYISFQDVSLGLRFQRSF